MKTQKKITKYIIYLILSILGLLFVFLGLPVIIFFLTQNKTALLPMWMILCGMGCWIFLVPIVWCIEKINDIKLDRAREKNLSQY